MENAAELERVHAHVLGVLDRADFINRIRHKDGRWVEAELLACVSRQLV